jgi:probable rRNA maturation factor
MKDPAIADRTSAAASVKADIVLQNPNRYPEASARRLRPWLERLVEELAARELPALPADTGAVSLGVRFAGDRELRRVNRDFRGQDKPTDVLSFPGDPAETGPDGTHLGDVLISVPTARRQAAERGHSAERELKVLLLHGVLHCLGYDHETDRGEMERLERRLRRAWIADEAPEDHA